MTAPAPMPAGDVLDGLGPEELLGSAWALEPSLALARRGAVLDRLAEVLDGEDVRPAPPGRDWYLELLAERAVDASTHVRLEEVLALTDQVRRFASEENATVALARATWARGRALAWAGTDATRSEGARELTRAAELFAGLGRGEWQGYTLVWHGHSIHYEHGSPHSAGEMMRAGLSLLAPDSPWRPTALVFLSDVELELGELDGARASLDEADRLAERWGDAKASSYVKWNRAHLAAARGDARSTEQRLAEVARAGGDWFDSHLGIYFLADAAALLDQLGRTEPAQRYLDLAQGRGSVDDDYVVLARALSLARNGDPHQGEATLQEVARNEWVEKRLVWRNTLLLAWSTLRGGGRSDAGRVARRAFAQVVDAGGLVVAHTAEPLITAALAPLAEEVGCPHGRSILLETGGLIVRLFGTTTVSDPAGRLIELPGGMPGELVRMLALAPGGIPVEIVLDRFFPHAPPSVARQRLRQLLRRLRSGMGEVVLRDGDLLALAPAWVDTRRFEALAAQACASTGAGAIRCAHAALALAGRGPLLARDPYAEWAESARDAFAHTRGELEMILAATAT